MKRTVTEVELATINKIRAQNDMDPLTVDEAYSHTKYFSAVDWVNLQKEIQNEQDKS